MKHLYTRIYEDQKSILTDYEVDDKTLLKEVYGLLAIINLFEKNSGEATENFQKVKALQEKPSAKLTSGLVSITYLESLSKSDDSNFKEVFKSMLKNKVDELPWDIVQDDIEQTKGSYEIYSENLIIGILKEQIDPIYERSDGALSSDFANQLVSMKYMIDYVLPIKQEVIEVYSNYIEAHKIDKKDIWAERDVMLTSDDNLQNVLIAIWDSGVDSAVFKDNMFVNKNEVYDGKDNDNNGYIDDIHANKTNGILYPLPTDKRGKLESIVNMTKGLLDLQANIDSKEASELKAYMSEIKTEEVKPFIEELNLFGNYSHGTHVTGITVHGNPKAVILASRLTFDYHMIPECPTIEQAQKDATQATEVIDYYKKQGVRIVNMSFGGSVSGVESALEMNGKGETPEERKKMAREIFDIGKDAFYNAIKDAPEILFIAAAGNSDEDAEFYDAIPSSFNLPNILTVGAVDQAGEETSFTSFGKNVDVHANGFEVNSYIPGGKKMKFSGTSMSSPNVANLAGKILALNPDLTVEKVIDIIKNGCDKSEDGRIVLINPKKSIELVNRL
jgi:subtilisin family serine protease